MNESAKSAQPIFSPQWAIRFGAALVVALTLVVGFASFDGTRRKQLESTSETTAAGDVKYFKPPADAKALPVVAAAWNGQRLMVSAVAEIDVRDTHVRRVGVDAASGLTIYELSEAATEEERSRVTASGAAFLLKLAPNEYVGAQVAVP
jgi:hypothetical protein